MQREHVGQARTGDGEEKHERRWGERGRGCERVSGDGVRQSERCTTAHEEAGGVRGVRERKQADTAALFLSQRSLLRSARLSCLRRLPPPSLVPHTRAGRASFAGSAPDSPLDRTRRESPCRWAPVWPDQPVQPVQRSFRPRPRRPARRPRTLPTHQRPNHPPPPCALCTSATHYAAIVAPALRQGHSASPIPPKAPRSSSQRRCSHVTLSRPSPGLVPSSSINQMREEKLHASGKDPSVEAAAGESCRHQTPPGRSGNRPLATVQRGEEPPSPPPLPSSAWGRPLDPTCHLYPDFENCRMHLARIVTVDYYFWESP